MDQVAREYVLALAAEVDMMRTGMQNAGLWVPPVLGPPRSVSPSLAGRQLAASTTQRLKDQIH